VRQVEDSHAAAADPRVYEVAHELLSRKKWIRGRLYVNGKGLPYTRADTYRASAMCIMGALEAAAHKLRYSDANWYLMIAPATRMMQLDRSANAWNNEVAQSKDDVLYALEQGRYYAELEK
jgi:hypothetical protein